MRTLPIRAIPLLLAASLPAQVTIKAITVQPVTAAAEATLAPKVTKSIPANTDVSKGFDLTASTRAGLCQSAGHVRLKIGPLFGGLNADLSAYGVSTQGGGCYTTSHGGANGVLITFSSKQPVAGGLIVTAYPKSVGWAPRASAFVDVGNDGSRELDGSGQRTIPVVLGPRGTPVLLGGQAPNHSNNRTSMVAAVLFVPHGSKFSVIGTPCRGMKLEAVYSSSLLMMRAAGLPKAKHAFVAFGLTPLNFAIPPLGCRLHTDLLVLAGVQVNASGDATLGYVVRNPEPKGTFRIQVLASDGNAWHTSNALSLTLR